jgi:predicted amidohydrolase YtcJ
MKLRHLITQKLAASLAAAKPKDLWITRGLTLCLSVWLASSRLTLAASPTADLIIDHAKIYAPAASQASSPYVTALALRAGKIIAVGSHATVWATRGPATRVVDLHGQVVLPGLIDAHIHPMDILDLDVCDLHSQPVSLEQLAHIVAGCVKRYQLAPGQWLAVHQWSNTNGNQLSPRLKTLRQALDAGAPHNPVIVMGNDGHHYAYNSQAFLLARTKTGEAVPLNRISLAKQYAAYQNWIGIDATGEPDGAMNEAARYLVDPADTLTNELAEVAKAPQRVVNKLNAAGITGMLDAAVSKGALPIYRALADQQQLTVWTNLALYFDPYQYTDENGETHFDLMLARAREYREQIEHNTQIKADTVKLFADGVLEGNPFATPPTLPNSPALRDYLQPIYKPTAAGTASVVGYVDVDSAVCVAARAQGFEQLSLEAVQAFRAEHGFHPRQCLKQRGRFQDAAAVETEFVKRFHAAGFSVHIHAISDAAVRLAIDAIEAARLDGNRQTRDGLAHVQLATPEDVTRMGADHLFLAYTFAWMIGDPEYDLTVVPFVEKVKGHTFADMHPANSRYDQMVYPVKDTQVAGAIITGGSDAPVETSDPRPFVNMARAVSRQLPNSVNRLVPRQAISITDAIDAYTIHGAQALGREQEIGSLEVGKSADFIVIDRDPLQLAQTHQWQRLENTQVMQTYFAGQRVYQRKTSPQQNSAVATAGKKT